MPKPPQMSGVEVVKAFQTMGFEEIGGSGSHAVFQDPHTGNTTTVPRHRTDIVPNTMRSIMKQIGVTAEELKNPGKARRAREAARDTTKAANLAGNTSGAQGATRGEGGQQQPAAKVRHGKAAGRVSQR